MNKPLCVSVYLRRNILYYIPDARAGGLGIAQFHDAAILPFGATSMEKGQTLLDVLKHSGGEVPRPDFSNETFKQRVAPFLNLAKLKSWSTFVGNALSFSIRLDEKGFTFCPDEYDRGGFSGIDPDVVIPADSSDEVIGQAIDQVLLHCIGKGGKRLADFQKEVPKPPLSESEITPGKGISGFGFKTMWFAVKSQNPKRVADALNIKTPMEVGWDQGVKEAYKNSVFITPPIDGWVLVVGWGLLSGEVTDEILLIMTKSLSKEFGEAQFFSTHRVTEAHVWVKAVNGQIVRAYSYIGERGENSFVEGEPTPVERQWNLINTFLPEAENDDYWEKATHPDEDIVMKVAESWSVNPSELSGREDIQNMGLLGNVNYS